MPHSSHAYTQADFDTLQPPPSRERFPSAPHLQAVPPPLEIAGDRQQDQHFNQVAIDTSSPEDVAAPAAKVLQRLALYAFEALDGVRSITQLAGWITPPVAAGIADRRAARNQRRSLNSDHRRVVATPGPVHIDRPVPHVIEVAVSLYAEPRTHPVAMRLEHRDHRWRVTELVVL